MIAALKSATYFGLKRALTRSEVHSHFRFYLKTQTLPADELAKLQAELLADLCSAAVRSVPAYRARFERAGLHPDQLRAAQTAIAALPLLTRDELIANNQEFLSEAEIGSPLEIVSTSGSTGAPLRVARDGHARDWSLATTFLYNAWLGLRVGVPHLFLWGGPDARERVRLSLKHFNLSVLHSRRTLESSTMSTDKEHAHLLTINRQTECDYLLGYANEIYKLATRSLEQGPKINRALKAVVTTAEDLTTSMRATIERAFQSRVFNRYGSRETGDIASECEHQAGLHVNPLFAYVEVADDDGRSLPYGQEGQLLITGLHNRVMPLIRYAIGDRGVLRAPDRCKCGREWPTITALTGRVNDFIYLPGGVRLRAAALDSLIEALPALQRYQVYQESENSLRIRLQCSVPNYVTVHRGALDSVAIALQQRAVAPLNVSFEQTDFHKTNAGKELKIVRSRALDATLRAARAEPRP